MSMKHNTLAFGTLAGASALLGLTGCSNDAYRELDPGDPGRGQADLLPASDPVSDGNFAGGGDTLPAARAIPADALGMPAALPAPCDGACRQHCATSALENPVNQGLCSTLWGAGLEHRPVNLGEACRRVYADVAGHFPNGEELSACSSGSWSALVKELLEEEAFVGIQKRRWADTLRYDTQTVSVERIYDADKLVDLLYRGQLAYDHFAALMSAHPVLTRRYNTPGDRVEALFNVFLGRPPFEDERADLGRLYSIWDNGYHDHPDLELRLPDAFVNYRCLTEDGEITEESAGDCTSIKFGYTQVVLAPDARASSNDNGEMTMWSGLMTPAEWETVQAPGRLLAKEWAFWEQAANSVLEQYLGYALGSMAPEVTEQLVRYVLANNGDIRALHFAVLTSAAYLQSSAGDLDTQVRYTYGPLKQADAETYVDSLHHLAGFESQRCDYRINRIDDFLDADNAYALALLDASDWELNDDADGVRSGYRNLVQNLGGCPDNSQGGRFKIVSVLTTATQLNLVGEMCDPGLTEEGNRAEIARLLPAGLDPRTSVTPERAQQIFDHQVHQFYGRAATAEELESAAVAGTECQLTQCDAEAFARPTCFAVLGSAEMLFY